MKRLTNEYIDPSEFDGYFEASDQIEDAIKYLLGNVIKEWMKATRKENGFVLFADRKEFKVSVCCDHNPDEKAQIYEAMLRMTPQDFAHELCGVVNSWTEADPKATADALAFLSEVTGYIVNNSIKELE